MSFVAYAMLAVCTLTRCSLRGSVSVNNTLASRCNDQGIDFLRSEQTFHAVQMFRSAIDYKSDYLVAYTNLGFAHLIRQEFDEATTVLETAVYLEPMNFLNYFYLGIAHSVSNIERAAHDFERAISLNPGFKPAIFRVGLAYLLLNETDKAMERFKNISEDSLTEAYTRTGHEYLTFNRTAIHAALRL